MTTTLSAELEKRISRTSENVIKEAETNLRINRVFQQRLVNLIPDIAIEDTDYFSYFGTAIYLTFRWWSWDRLHEIVQELQSYGWEIAEQPERKPENLYVYVDLTHPSFNEALQREVPYRQVSLRLMMQLQAPSADETTKVLDECVVVQVGTRTETKEVPVFDVMCKEDATKAGLLVAEVA